VDERKPLYWGIGNKHGEDNIINVSAMLFMWTTLPAFGAAAYVPQIVMERSLFMRERADGRGFHSSTLQLNLSAFCGIGGALGGCVARLTAVFGGVQGV
jgi:hypothetical protein